MPVEDRHHFFAYAARVMRSVIVDFARARAAERRGGEATTSCSTRRWPRRSPRPRTTCCRCTRRCEALAQADERLARIVEMRYFGGLSEAEIGEVLGVSERTVRRDWEKARLLLMAALR